MSTQKTVTEDVVITRILDAPLEMVWKAWTDPEQIMRWWGPRYYTAPYAKVDLRQGGKFVFAMLAPKEQGGQESYTSGTYSKVIPMERLEFTQGLSDKDGNPIDPAQLGMPADFPREIRTSVVFKAKGSMTEITITEYAWTPGQMMVYSYAGMQQSIDKMAESLARK
ncbi:MAG TPA: SRPBCC domain-containing protein [Anaerolineales bacterium]